MDISHERVAEFSVTAANLAPDVRNRLIAGTAVRFKKFIVKIAAAPEVAPKPLKLVAMATADFSQGAGLG